MALSPAVPEIGFLHRHAEAAEIYFVANTSNVPQRTRAVFCTLYSSRSARAVQSPAGPHAERAEYALSAQWWNPMDGSITPAETQAEPNGNMAVALDLEPYGSRVLVFTKDAATRVAAKSAVAVPPALDLSADWRVSFGPDGTPKQMEKLHSWTDDEDTRYFSGLATYEKTVHRAGEYAQVGAGTCSWILAKDVLSRRRRRRPWA